MSSGLAGEDAEVVDAGCSVGGGGAPRGGEGIFTGGGLAANTLPIVLLTAVT